jgi:hypothetical protein
VAELRDLIREDEAALLGSIRQEVLSGIKGTKEFERIAEALRAFPDESMAPVDFETAAHFSNECQRRGLMGGTVDFQICSAAVRLQAPIFTTDRDFEQFSAVLPIRLYDLRARGVSD